MIVFPVKPTLTRILNMRLVRRVALWNWLRWLPRRVQAWLVCRSGLFDASWCLGEPGKERLYWAAARLFVEQELSCRANPLFDADWYRNRYGFLGTPSEALLHYWFVGDRVGLSPSPWFNTRFFRRYYGFRAWRGCALRQFLVRWSELRIGNPLFDPDWYLAEYPDVARAGANPLVHFVSNGVDEGRSPNAFVSPAEYLDLNPDVAKAGSNPMRHFFVHGAFEGRIPSRRFNPTDYLSRYPDAAHTGLHPLAHFLVEGRAFGCTVPSLTSKPRDLLPIGTAKAVPRDGTIDLVVPVYRGLGETRACIESILSSGNSTSVRTWVYNDASPDPEVTEYLRALAVRDPAVRLVENERNLGFVGTVNRAMRTALNFDDSIGVLLLNSDTIVAGNWIDRLAAHLQPHVASITALSNNATICSYPSPGAHSMPEGSSTFELDAIAARVNSGSAVEIPTGVGFCMLISREALEVVGLFDEEAFGKGYGEENDFSMRAAQLGFRNLLAMDVFVQHHGEISFAETSKPGKLRAENTIAARYPDYSKSVADWMRLDPAALGRIRITLERWRSDAMCTWLLVSHSLGGGTERHVTARACELAQSGNHVVIMEPAMFRKDAVNLRSFGGTDDFQVELLIENGHDMTVLLRALSIDRIEVHHLMGYGEFMRQGLAEFKGGFDFFVHDFYSLCPQVTLTDPSGRYCGELGLSACDSCIVARPTHGARDIRNWRTANEWMVKTANSVFAPSHDAADRIQRYFQRRPAVVYHEDEIPTQCLATSAAPSRGRPLRVVLIGVLAPHKGQRLVFDAACAAAQRRLPLSFHLVGDPQATVPKASSDHFSWTGWYQEEDLQDLLEHAEPDVFLFASQAPETYSFTLTKAMSTGLPIVATRLGAFPERLGSYPGAVLFDPWITGNQLADLLVTRYCNEFELANDR